MKRSHIGWRRYIWDGSYIAYEIDAIVDVTEVTLLIVDDFWYFIQDFNLGYPIFI